MLRESVWRLVVDNIATFQVPEMRRIGRIHFVGIGGSGMCGIAAVSYTNVTMTTSNAV